MNISKFILNNSKKLLQQQKISQKNFFSSSSQVKNLLVVGEHDNGELSASTLNTIGAAKQLNKDIVAVVGGSNASKAAESLSKVDGVSRVLVDENAQLDHGLAESWAPFLKSLQDESSFTHIFGSASSSAKSFMPRLAALLDVQPVSEITEIKDENTFVRPIYAGNALQTIRSSDNVKVVTVRGTSFEAAQSSDNSAESQTLSSHTHSNDLSAWNSAELTKSERPELSSAKIVVSGGRALKSKENFDLIYGFADKIGAAVGASRAAVDAGYCPNDMQVGQTGKIVAPELYFAFGISGAIQHVAGMKDSKVIVAVNKDEEAPIFQIADYGLVGDLFDVIPELEKNL